MLILWPLLYEYLKYMIYQNRNQGKYLIHVYCLQSFSPSKNDGMILIFGFPFTNICWTTRKLDTVYFLEYKKVSTIIHQLVDILYFIQSNWIQKCKDRIFILCTLLNCLNQKIHESYGSKSANDKSLRNVGRI